MTQLRARLFAVVWVALLTFAGTRCVVAQIAIPPELRDWQGWVLHGHEKHRCPWLTPGQPSDQNRVCAWPATLELAVDSHGARFTQRWQAAAETWLPLPGDTQNWPENVTLDGKPAAVLARQGGPVVRVTPGAHVLAGAYTWLRRPQTLPLAMSVALIQLTIDGARVALPQRDAEGVTLGTQGGPRQDNRLDVRVFRQLDDSLPSLLTTQIHLAVAGEAREVRLPQVLPEGFVPTAVDGELGARLDPDNTLRVQVRPGEFDLTVLARGPSPLAQVRLGEHASPWPPQEVWSFRAEDRLRVVSVEGATLTDPAQANVPPDWRTLPAYRMEADSVFRVVERSRGLGPADANRLQLQRTTWLDFSGAGYTVVDNLTGTMRQGWRLDMHAPYALAGVRTGNDWLLVTGGPQRGTTGVEVRDSEIKLAAISRLPRTGAVVQPATGWSERFTQVSGRLLMAPGYRLLAALGPDAAPQAWIERWRLLDIFALLLIATVAWRVLGVRIALVAVATVALTHQESDSATWLWLNLLVALALLRAAPEGRVRQWAAAYRLVAIALLTVVLVPFVVTQARLALYPQLEFVTDGYVPASAELRATANRVEMQKTEAPAPPPAEVPPDSTGGNQSLSSRISEEVVVTGARRTTVPAGYEPGVQVQSGPGLPAWQYRAYDYSWSGPVEESATVHFIVSPPWLTALWRIAGVSLSGLLLWLLARGALPALSVLMARKPAHTTLMLLLATTWMCGGVSPARAASTPGSDILNDLRTRLLADPKCAPDCAAIMSAQVIAGARLSVILNVSALDDVGVALPGADSTWSPDLVQVDGAAAGWVYRDAQGVRYVSVSPGRHAVRIEGPLAGLEGLALAFPLTPQLVDVTAEGWEVSGVTGRRLVSGALQLVRRHTASANGLGLHAEEFPPYVVVERLFHLAHDWTIDTRLTRVAPESRAFTVELPLLPQEAVTTPGLEASQGRAIVGVGAGEDDADFTSVIPVAGTLELTAAAGPYSEHWSFDVSRTWHVEFAGVPPVAPEGSGVWLFEYYPRPGEHLHLTITRPTPVPGSTVAFDHVELETRVGKRSSDASLVLNYRSTQGGRQVLRLPPQAQVTSVESDGSPVALQPEHDELPLSALPGTHTWKVEWQVPRGVTLLTRSPAVGLSAPASNLNVTVQLPGDRWVLYAFGAGVGPVILYWGELLLFIVSAWFLGRSRLTPLRSRDWLLLGLGLSTFSWSVLLLFAAFVAAFQWRSRAAPPAEAARFNALQVGLAVLAVAAVFAVVAAVPRGLLGHPDMRIAGGNGYADLRWFMDQSRQQLPLAGVISVPLWWYKLAMLAWALWLSFALTGWIKWAWQVFARDGLWRQYRRPRVPPPEAGPTAGRA